MKENIEQGGNEISREKRERRAKELSLELAESGETFTFPGLRAGAHELLKEADDLAGSGYVTPIDDLLTLMKEQGMQIDKGHQIKTTEKDTSIVTVRPAGTEAGFYGENLLHLKNLNITSDMDPRLVELIELHSE
jgi:hypothetical protein